MSYAEHVAAVDLMVQPDGLTAPRAMLPNLKLHRIVNSVCAGSEPTGVGFGVLRLLRFFTRCLKEYPKHIYMFECRDDLDTIENVWLRCNLCSLSEEIISPLTYLICINMYGE